MQRARQTNKNKNQEEFNVLGFAIPLAVALAGLGAILFAVYLADEPEETYLDENQYDVENYDVKDKPYIYAY